MVNGCKTLTPVVVVDLDGTLVDVNTFREYILFVTKQLLKQGKLLAAAKVITAVALRKTRFISHSEMKKRILVATRKIMTNDNLDLLVRGLLGRLNVDVFNKLERYRADGYRVLLATAAPEIYARSLAEALRFDGCVATSDVAPENEAWNENVGEVKLASVRDYVSSVEGHISVVMTDHYDDLPLMHYNTGMNILVNPSEKTVSAISRHGIVFTIM